MNTQNENVLKAQKYLKFGETFKASQFLDKAILSDDLSDRALAYELLFFEIAVKKRSWERAILLGEKILNDELLSEAFKNRVIDELKIIHELAKVKPLNYQKEDYVDFIKFIESFGTKQNTEFTPSDRFYNVSIEEAEALAHNQNIEPPYLSWNGIRAQESKESYSLIYLNRYDIKPFKLQMAQIEKLLFSRFGHISSNFDFFYDDIQADLEILARAILVGYNSKLLIEMRRAYESQNIPCGWKGDYPDGSLCCCPLFI